MIRGHLWSFEVIFEARLVPYGGIWGNKGYWGIWVFMISGIGSVFVIEIDIFDRLDFFRSVKKSDYKK